MTVDPEMNVMRQVRDRLLEYMGDSAEVEGDTVTIYGITEEEWSDPEVQRLLFDEPNVEPVVEENSDTYTVHIPINHD